MIGAALGLLIWLLGFAAAGIGFFSLFDEAMAALFDVFLTWTQVPVVGLAYLTLYREGIPSGAGELKSALAWFRENDPDDVARAPFNSVLVALELGAVILVAVGLAMCTFFSMTITVATIGAFGRAVADPTTITFAGVEPSDAFAVFLSGGLLWQVAWIVEAFEVT